ncbi:DMT family transporter [Acidilutibacter cellobiosedens]|jgi:transporter family-2 protein|uniref:DMT family transporter n=1 Tax=Acidilutibacter cellobiosedens TaxID=2507161 RepID=A0A410Q952_9FIRM|nr:DMT family transporter [Acidilutibacter cellobiosedens]MBE6083725.1 DMT family transporter [Tissierellaceae bacterium]QAT60501.1 DMT family transporter [Acidilutibacter cellobiosedens]
MVGILFSLLTGILVSLQVVFNNRVSDKIGLWETTVIVHAVGLIFGIILMAVFGDGNLGKIGEVKKLYLIGGMFGVIIVYSSMVGIILLGAAFSTSVMLIAQLIVATAIDAFGLFGASRIEFDFTKLLGVLIMIIGIIVFKLRG